jgi:hypothetical protein
MPSVMVMNMMLLTSETQTMWPGASADGCGWGWCCWWQHSCGQVFNLGSAQGSWAGAVWFGWGWFCCSGSRHGFTEVMTQPEMCFFGDGSRLDKIRNTQKAANVGMARSTQLSSSPGADRWSQYKSNLPGGSPAANVRWTVPRVGPVFCVSIHFVRRLVLNLLWARAVWCALGWYQYQVCQAFSLGSAPKYEHAHFLNSMVWMNMTSEATYHNIHLVRCLVLDCTYSRSEHMQCGKDWDDPKNAFT